MAMVCKASLHIVRATNSWIVNACKSASVSRERLLSSIVMRVVCYLCVVRQLTLIKELDRILTPCFDMLTFKKHNSCNRYLLQKHLS